MKTVMHPRFVKLAGVILLAMFLTVLLLAFAQMAQNPSASIGWPELASVGWVG